MLRIYNALKSSRAAIDLASIMVGIIVIGLIGGVIAATVFAVIPWAQDNAAKQQLDGVASAESAYRGLSTSKDANLQNAVTSPTNQSDPNQAVLNSTFTGSTGLAKNNLLTLDTSGNYCVVATTDGKDYHAYSKSGSGKWFYITSGKTQPSLYTAGNTPCLTTGAVDTTVDNGSGPVGTAPTGNNGNGTTTPTANIVKTYDFEDQNISDFTPFSSNPTTISVSNTKSHGGTYSLHSYGTSSGTNGVSTNKFTTIKAGSNYRVTASIYLQQGSWVNIKAFGIWYDDVKKSYPVTSSNSGQWVTVSYDLTATSSNTSVLAFYSMNGSDFYVDDITVEAL